MAREYLQLIARENDRLSRLIHNFLTFILPRYNYCWSEVKGNLCLYFAISVAEHGMII